MRIAVGFAGAMVFVVLVVRRELFEPRVDVVNQTVFVIVHVDAGGDVHGGDEDDAVLHAGLAQDLLDLRRDVDILAMLLRVEREVFGVRSHVGEIVEAQAARRCLWMKRATTLRSSMNFRISS